MKKHYYKDEIRRLLILYTISFILVSVILMFIFVGFYSNTIIRNNNRLANDDIVEQLTNEFGYYTSFVSDSQNEPDIIEYFDLGTEVNGIYERMYAFINDRKIKGMFYLVNTNGNTVVTNNYVESPYNSIDLFDYGLFKRLKESDEIVFMNNKVQIDLSTRTIYSIGISIKDEGETVGYLVFDILEKDINKVIDSNSVDIFVISDQYNNSIVSSNSLILDDIGKLSITKRSDEIILFMEREYYFYRGVLLEDNIYVYTFSELGLVYNLMLMSLVFMLIVMVVITLIIFRASDYIARKKTRSINDLILAMNAVKSGDLKAYVSLDTGDEFEEIGSQFNRMLDRLDNQIRLNIELNDRKRLAIIKQLEAQFNPHFIFNTLELLKYLIQIDQDKSSELIIHFANLLRYSIDYEKKNILLKEDFEYIKSYLMIQKYRYNKRLTYTVEFEDELATCIVPKLILQPIIENCIIHGYKKKTDLNIAVTVKRDDEMLLMTVSDNGDGIPYNRLQEINEGLDDEEILTNSIGLNNVHRRLKLIYNDECGVKIESEENIGTSVFVRMPIEYLE